MRLRVAARTVLLAALLTIGLAPPGRAAEEKPAAASPNVRHVANLAYQTRYGQELPHGTDIELRRYGTRVIAFAGTYMNGLQVIDVTRPAAPRILAVYDCALAQGDVQVFAQGRRVLVAYTADDYGEDYTKVASRCFRENGITKLAYGTFLVDVTNPAKPTTVGFANLPKGSHNQTVHPSGRYLYNSNSDLGPTLGAIEIVDIANPAAPKQVATLELESGIDSHDITFSADGTRAYVAAITHTLVLDTTKPAAPTIVGRILDPTINIHHQADPVTIGDRTFLIVTDELAGAAGNGFCPGGGLHVFDITGEREAMPIKVGFFVAPDVGPTTGASITCTSHVLRIHPKERLATIAWYAGGTRILDLGGLADSIPTISEVGFAWFDDSDTWSAKALTVTRDGTFHVFANDIQRGLDVFAVTLRDGAPPAGGAARLARVSPKASTASADRRPYCVLLAR